MEGSESTTGSVGEDQHAVLKRLLESFDASDGQGQSGAIRELLVAALSQVGGSHESEVRAIVPEDELSHVNNVETTVEVPSEKHKTLGIKFPVEVRRKIINMRKEGKKCKDIAKELGASVSGVQKVWERFLSTGRIHDRKPSTYAGRARKYSSMEEEEVIYVPVHSSNAVAMATTTSHICDMTGANIEVSSSATPTVEVTMDMELMKRQKGSHAYYREELLTRLVVECPLAVMRRDRVNLAHVNNLKTSMKKPLYMEYVLGHPFGKAPPSKPFEYDSEDTKMIVTDPCNPLGKELLSALGYSTKVYFNACCSPSPLFDRDKVIHCLPLSIGPHHIAQSLRAVLQLFVDLCTDKEHALSLIVEGTGPSVTTTSATGETLSKSFTAPSKLSQYWMQVYDYCNIFKCCENFLSATTPSAPCLMCHSFESFAENLHISESHSPSPSPSCNVLESFQEKEVRVTEIDGIQYVAYMEPLLNDTPTNNNDTPTTISDTPTTINDTPTIINNDMPTTLACTDEDDATAANDAPTTPRRSSRNKTKIS